MSPVQTHTLRACSLLVIPPPPDRIPTQGGFPMDLSQLNLSGWATLVQDVAAGLQVLPPNLSRDMVLPAVAQLQASRHVDRTRVLPLLLPRGLPVHMHGSLPTGSPPVMEPDSRTNTRVWSDCLLWRHDHS